MITIVITSYDHKAIFSFLYSCGFQASLLYTYSYFYTPRRSAGGYQPAPRTGKAPQVGKKEFPGCAGVEGRLGLGSGACF
jgi:hypothetical protein